MNEEMPLLTEKSKVLYSIQEAQNKFMSNDYVSTKMILNQALSRLKNLTNLEKTLDKPLNS